MMATLGLILVSVMVMASSRELQRPVFHFAPLNTAAGLLPAMAELKCDGTARQLAVIARRRFHAVQHDAQVRVFNGNHVGAPLTACLEHGRSLYQMLKGARAESGVGTAVEDVRLVTGPVGDLGGVGTAHED